MLFFFLERLGRASLPFVFVHRIPPRSDALRLLIALLYNGCCLLNELPLGT